MRENQAIPGSAGNRLKFLASTVFELPAGKSRLPAIEGMRGFSAFLVFFVHFYALFGVRMDATLANNFFSFLAVIGHCGVDLFFALSGFVIYGPLLAKRTGYADFVKRRVVRLYPTFTIVLVLYWLAGIALPFYSRVPGPRVAAVGYLAANFLMLPGIFPIVPMITVAWSLSYELAFYLTLPLLIRVAAIYQWRPAARIVFFLALCATYVFLWQHKILLHPRMIMFGCGILARETFHLRIWKTFTASVVATVIGIASLILLGLTGEPVLARYCGPFITSSLGNLLVLFGAVYLLSCVAIGGQNFLAAFFSRDWLRWLGNMSYSYYLAHGALLHILRAGVDAIGLPKELSTLASAALCFGAFAFTLAGSAVLFLVVEKPMSLSSKGNRGAEASPLPHIQHTRDQVIG